LSEPAFDELLRRLAEAGDRQPQASGRCRDRSRRARSARRGSARKSNLDCLRTREREQVAIETDLGRLDVVQGLDGVPSYADLRSRAVEAEILGVAVAVCSIQDLRGMKHAAGRTRDLADLEDLDAAGS
jgi:hypothetical protein